MATIGQIASGSAPSVPGLRRDAIGLREVLFQSITDMAPGAAIAASIPAGALYAGGALPLSVLIALVACLLTASCIGLLAHELPSAGSLATYVARGLHPAVGFLTAWGYVLVYVLVAPLVLLQLGFTTASTINSDFHGYPANLWWPWSLAGAVIILAAGFYGIRTSARLGTILGTTEIAVFLVLAVLFVVHAGHANTASVFTTKYTPKGFHGISGVIAGSVYSILAFGGFEGAAPLAEEARNPRRTIPRPKWTRSLRTRGANARGTNRHDRVGARFVLTPEYPSRSVTITGRARRAEMRRYASLPVWSSGGLAPYLMVVMTGPAVRGRMSRRPGRSW